MSSQLPLQVELPNSASLDAFVGQTNAAVCQAVERAIQGDGRQIYLHGMAATGKTHLLQAACRAVAEHGQPSAYIPLKDYAQQAADLLPGMQTLDCVCVDQVSAIAGDRESEIALVGLIDGLRANNGMLLLADRLPASDINLSLADLTSRLGWGAVYALNPPSDQDKEQLLISRASQQGIQMPLATARFLIRHANRNIQYLLDILDQLDTASLAAKRRLTIPFVKQVLGI